VHRGRTRRVPSPARAGVRQRLRRPDRDRQRARHGDREAAGARRTARPGREPRRRAPRREREPLPRRRPPARVAHPLLRPQPAAGGRAVRGAGGRVPPRHDDGRAPRLERARGRIGEPDPDEGADVSVAQTRVDPVTAAVIAGGLDSIAVEMGHKLARMAYSSIIRESEDFGCVLCDAEGRQLCESSQSTPLQSGPIPGYIAGVNRRFAELGLEWRPGDVVIHIHAYYGASHPPDVCFCAAVFYDGELVGFSATTAHHLDLGALTPGSCGIVDATDAYAEGLQLNAVKIEEEGRRNTFIWQILRDNCRAPHLVVGDMEAQVAAAKIGAGRFVELIERYGIDTVRAASEDLMDYSDRMLRREIERLPDGTYEAEGHLDGFVDHPDPAYRNLKIRVALTVEGTEITVDLTGTSPQVDLPINMPLVGTVDIAVWVTLRSILLDAA